MNRVSVEIFSDDIYTSLTHFILLVLVSVL